MRKEIKYPEAASKFALWWTNDDKVIATLAKDGELVLQDGWEKHPNADLLRAIVAHGNRRATELTVEVPIVDTIAKFK